MSEVKTNSSVFANNAFTFNWTIKDFAFCTEEQFIVSDVFTIKTFLNSQWYLSVHLYKECTVVSLVLSNARKKCCKFAYAVEIVCTDGVHLCGSSARARLQPGGGKKFTIAHRDSLLIRKNHYLPNNNLTLRCKIWNRLSNMAENLSSSCVTEINTDFSTFVTVLKELKKDDNFISDKIFFSEQIVTPFTFQFVIDKAKEENETILKVIYTESPKIFVQGSVDLLNANGRKIAFLIFQKFFNTRETQICLASSKNFSDFLNDTNMKEELGNYSFKFLLKTPENTIKMSPSLYSWPKFRNNLSFHSNVNYVANLPPRMTKTFSKTPNTLADGLRALYHENKLTDCVLKVENIDLPVHKMILYCRSPVFQRMFESDMKEKFTQEVQISDVDPNTMKQILDFMYLDSFCNNITLEDALKLYSASNKYMIEQLKIHCSEFLKSILNSDNFYVILLLSHLYSDLELKSAVQKHLMNNVDIFGTQKWNEFAEEHTLIASKLMQDYILSKHSTMPPRPDISEVEKANSDADRDLVSALIRSYLDDSFCDCILCVRNSRFSVHSVVLYARSDVLSALFRTAEFNTTLGAKEVTLSDSFEPKTIESMIRFMYFDTIDFNDWQEIIEMYVASTEYQFISLKDNCALHMALNLTIDNIGQALTLADSHKDIPLKLAVENFIFSNPNLVFRSSEWKIAYKTCPRLSGEIMMKYLSEN